MKIVKKSEKKTKSSLFRSFPPSISEMLTAGEKIGMRQLLLQLEDEVVFSLAETVTKRALALTCVGGNNFVYGRIKSIWR